MRSYEAARTYFSILSFISWCVILLGVVVVLVGFGAASQMSRGFGGTPSGLALLSAVVPGAGLAFAGFMGLVFAQIGRAGVDTAEYSQQSLKVARDALEVSRHSLQKADDLRQGFEGLRVREPEPARVSFEELRSARAKAEPETPAADDVDAPEQIAPTPPVEAVEAPAPEPFTAIEVAEPMVVAEASAPEPEPVPDIRAEPPVTRRRAPLYEVKWLSDTRLEYRGATVEVQDGQYVWDGLSFADEASARQYIDDLVRRSTQRPTTTRT